MIVCEHAAWLKPRPKMRGSPHHLKALDMKLSIGRRFFVPEFSALTYEFNVFVTKVYEAQNDTNYGYSSIY